MPSLRDNIIEILLSTKKISNEQLDEYIKIQKEKQVPLRKLLFESGAITEEQLLGLLSEQLYIPTLHLAKYKFDPEIVKLIPEHMAKQYVIIPISRIGNSWINS